MSPLTGLGLIGRIRGYKHVAPPGLLKPNCLLPTAYCLRFYAIFIPLNCPQQSDV